MTVKTNKSAAYVGVSLVALAAGMTFSAPALAQDAPADEIVVTGFKGSLAEALNVKKNEVGAVDAILAEDIADFPDLNLAEAIQRIPGVSIDRDAGEGRTITVRGLGPDFTRVRINGMEALSTTGGTDSSGGTNRSRGFDFNTFASELFRSITARKTATADVDEGALGATVDLQTARPFDFREDAFALSGQASYNTLSDNIGPRLAGLVSKKFADDTFGILVSAAYSDRSLLEEGFSAVRWANAGAFSNEAMFPGIADPDPAPGDQGAFHPRIPRYGKLKHDQERLGITGSVQWQPADTTLFNFDVLYSKFDATRAEQFLEAISFSRTNATGKGATDIVEVEIDADNDIVYGVFNDVDVRIENRFDQLKTRFLQAGLSGQHEFSDRFRTDFLIGATESNFDNPVQTTIIADALDVDGYSWDFRDNKRTPFIDYNIDVTDPSNFTVNEVRDRPNDVLNQYQTAQLNFSYDLSDELELEAGFSYKQFKFKSFEERRDTVLPAMDQFLLTSNNSVITKIKSSVGAPAGTDLEWVIPDIGVIADSIGLYTGNFPLRLQNGSIAKVSEEDLGGYFQAKLNTDLGAMPFRAVAGVRVVKTDVASSGILSNNYVTVESDYTDVLPSVNAVLEAAEGFFIRASVAKVMARPTLGSLTPGGSFSAFSRTLSFGNPMLDPFRAWNYDAALEWYFADDSLISAAFFYKDISSFVARQTDSVPFSELGLDSALLLDVATPSDIFDVTRNVNGEGGNLKGFEIQYQQPFTFLPGFLANTGFTGNYTYVTSRVNYASATEPPRYNDLLNLSNHAANATLYYEDDQFSARVATSFRSPYLQTFPGRNDNDEEGKNRVISLDFALSYALTDSIRLTVEGVNMLDTFNYQYVDSTNRTTVYHHTGREILFGARWAM